MSTFNLPDSEIEALQSLYNATNGDNWHWLNSTQFGTIAWAFSSTCNPCLDRWQGVTCTSQPVDNYLHVLSLKLDDTNLVGELPDNFGELPYVQMLQFQGNLLSGTIPRSVSNCSSILLVDFSYNRLVGAIPTELSGATTLRIFNVVANSLTGTLPSFFAELPDLINLVVGNNFLTGSIPTIYGTMAALQDLNVGDNFLTGTIPTTFSALTALNTLIMDINHFSGQLPDLSHAANLEYLYLDENELSGPIPHYVGALPTLLYFTADENHLSGSIPVSLGDSHSLQNIKLRINHLTGPITPQLGNILSLLVLDLYDNSLTGTIPVELINLLQITVLNLSSNKLSGSILPQLGQLNALQSLDLTDSGLTGTVPAELCNLQDMVYLKLGQNYLHGTVPSNIGSLNSVSYLSVHENMLTASIPAGLKDLHSLATLYLFSNKFTGSIAQFIDATAQPLLEFVQISDNRFTGQIPQDLFALPNLQTIVLGDNCFHGTLPSTMCTAVRARTISLDGLRSGTTCRDVIFPGASDAYTLSDNIRGGIPACLFELPLLNTLHLSGNGLTGSLPDLSVINANLVDVCLSDNRLTGTIPESFQQRIWYAFDLSSNQLRGTLSDQFATVPGNYSVMSKLGVTEVNGTYFNPRGEVSLRNNRLSGTIPDVIQKMHNVSVLKGNLFTCALDQHDLPPHDSGTATYSCGSNAFDVPYYVYLGLLLCALSCCGFLYAGKSSRTQEIQRGVSAYWSVGTWYLADETRGPDKLACFHFVLAVMETLCNVAALLTLMLLLVFLPVYVALSSTYGTHSDVYAWVGSAAYLSGVPAFVTLLILLCVLLVASALQCRRLLSISHERCSHRRPAPSTAGPESRKYVVLMYAVMFVINTAVVSAANVGFVLASLNAHAAVQTAAQISLSAFKLLWGNYGLIYLVRWTNDQLSAHTSTMNLHDSDFVFTVLLSAQVFNIIVVPCIVVVLLSPNCLNTALVAAPAVTTYFFYESCTLYSALFGCVETAPSSATTTYDPPFTYSYQCSASLITYYAPTFVFMGLMIAFAAPVVNFTKLILFKRAAAQKSAVWLRLLRMYVSRILRPVSACTKPYTPLRPLWDANDKLVVQFSYLGVLLTFALVFPPLAVVMLVSMCVAVAQSRIEVGRFLSEAIASNAHQFCDYIDAECEGVGTVPKIRQAARILGFVMCGFYSLFLFDTLGDAVGAERSFWVFIVVPLLPAMMMGACAVVEGVWHPAQTDGDLTDLTANHAAEDASGSNARAHTIGDSVELRDLGAVSSHEVHLADGSVVENVLHKA